MALSRLLPLLLLAGLLANSVPLLCADERVSTGEDIRVAQGEVLDEAVCFGCSIYVEGEIRRDTVVIGGHLEIGGEVGGDAVVIGGSARVSGLVGRDMVGVLANANMLPGAEVGNDLVVVFGELSRGGDASVHGEVVHVFGVDASRFASAIALWLLAALLLFLVLVLVSLVVLTLLCAAVLGEQRVQVLSATVRQRAGLSFLLGLGICIGSFVVTAFPMFLGLWIPGFETLVSLAVFVVMAVGYTGLSFAIGRRLSNDSSLLGACALGSVIIIIAQIIPIIGFFGFVVFSMLAAGSALASGMGSSIDWLGQRTSQPASRPVNQ